MLPVIMLCWKFHLIPTRDSQDIDHWNIYLQFWGHVRLGDSANKCACEKNKNRIKQIFGFDIELFHFQKHFRRSSFIFTSILLQCYEKIAAIINSIEWHYEIDSCSVSHCKSHGSCCCLELLPVNASSVRNVTKIRKKRQVAVYFDENIVQLK